jgi:glycosyltransferase involved in cell wall biosynthesis
MKIRIFDHASGYTGYSRNISGLAIALADLGVDIKVIQQKDDGYIPDKLVPLMEYDLQKAIKELDSETVIMGRTYNDIHLFKQFPHKMICSILVLEGDRIPEDWIAKANLIDQVWASSLYNQKMLEKNGVACNIVVIWHGFDENIYWNKWRGIDGKEKEEEIKPFVFLFVGGHTIRGDRKGADILAQAFNIFKPEDNVKLIFKINTSYNPDFDAIYDLKSLIRSDLHDKVEFITEFLDDNQMANLYRSADVSVTPSLGEAFCQSILESMACGTPCIVTNYSGYLDYCNQENSFLIPIEKRVIAHYGPFDIYSGSVWVKPDIKELEIRLKAAYVFPEAIKEAGHMAAKVQENMKWSDQAKKAIEVIENYGK